MINRKKLPEVEPVHIKPRFGMQPGKWLTILYSGILILLIFLLGFLPDLIHGYKRVKFESSVGNCAVYVDGLYEGGTPFTRSIKSGTHIAEYKINGVSIDQFEFKVGHPVFFSWLFPRKMTIRRENYVTEQAFYALSSEFLTDVSAYSAVLDYDSTFIYPALFTDFAECVSSYSDSAKVSEVFRTACLFITSEEMQNDAIEAGKILKINPDTSLKHDATVYGNTSEYTDSILNFDDFAIKGFKDTNGVSIASSLVTEKLFGAFVSENPQWSIDNRSALIEADYADSFYLEDVSFTKFRSATTAVKNISFIAAKAFCRWLSEKTGKQVFIPSEKNLLTAFNSSILDNPGIWEMTSSAYVPGDRFSTEVQDILAFYNAQTEISIVNGRSETEIGTAPVMLCSDFMGFRIAWM